MIFYTENPKIAPINCQINSVKLQNTKVTELLHLLARIKYISTTEKSVAYLYTTVTILKKQPGCGWH